MRRCGSLDADQSRLDDRRFRIRLHRSAYDADVASGIEVTYGYDGADQLTSLTYQNGGTTIGNLTYGYDAAGRRTSMGGTLAQVNLPAAITSTAHDAANRVRTWGSHTLAYDDNGALVSDADSMTQTYVCV